MAGRLKEAKMVKLSRAAKRAYETGGIGRGETVPNIFVNWESLYRQRERLAALVAVNLEIPEDVEEAGLLEVVDLRVSRELAVRYVPP